LMHQIKSNKHLVNGLSELILSYRPPRGGKNDGSIWSVDISGVHERHYCVMPERRIVLSRHETESKAASRLSLKHKKTGTKTELTWPAYSATLAWPNKIPIVYGDTYTLETENMMKGTKHFKKVILHRMPKNLPTKSHKVVWMAGKGCVSQANMLLASMH